MVTLSRAETQLGEACSKTDQLINSRTQRPECLVEECLFLRCGGDVAENPRQLKPAPRSVAAR
jgi:hypothetical protein